MRCLACRDSRSYRDWVITVSRLIKAPGWFREPDSIDLAPKRDLERIWDKSRAEIGVFGDVFRGITGFLRSHPNDRKILQKNPQD